MTSSAPLVLAGAGGSSADRVFERLVAAAAIGCFGCLVNPSSAQDAPQGARVVMLGDAAALAEEECWTPPAFAWIEMLDSGAAELASVVDRARRWDFFCSFGAQASADLPLAGRIVGLVARRRPDVGHDSLFDIELALHEAVSNALVHGNLGVCSMQELSIGALDEYSRRMEQGFSDPGLARRRVEVAGAFDDDGFCVEVTDEGAGYDAADVKSQGASGRGLELIAAVAQSCSTHDGGRRLSMRFKL